MLALAPRKEGALTTKGVLRVTAGTLRRGAMQSEFQPREFLGFPRCHHQPVPVWKDCRLWEGLGQDAQVSAHKLAAHTAVNNTQTNSSFFAKILQMGRSHFSWNSPTLKNENPRAPLLPFLLPVPPAPSALLSFLS